MYFTQAFFTFNGRLNRQGFWIGSGICAAFLLLVANLLPISLLFQQKTAAIFAILPLLLITYCWLAIIVKRLHDRGRSAKALAILLAPIGCFLIAPYSQGFMKLLLGQLFPIFIFAMLLMEWGVFVGQAQANRYGEQGETIRFKKG